MQGMLRLKEEDSQKKTTTEILPPSFLKEIR
jgi:hypothetical protein